MKRRRNFFLMILAAGVATFLATGLVQAQSYSHARIVRLSFVEGSVTLQRPDVSAWAEAPLNTPLQEGFRLSTGDRSFAEVEFENCGTARLGQLSLLDLTELALTPGGGKINHLQLEQGYATFHARMEGNEDSFEVTTPGVTVTARGHALFRVDLDQDVERVEVFRGAVDVSGDLGSWTLERDMVLELNPGSDEPAHVSEGITKDDWDNWVAERESHFAAAEASPPPNDYTTGPPSMLYGWSDLGQYGTWSYLQGWGYGWTPTLISSGWAPYSVGQWCWYPGWGWTWIPTEPWGWIPYHYGGWDFVPGIGWVWFPDGFTTWSPAPVTWYSGPGWIGWIPRSHPVHGGVLPNPCGAGQSCGGTAVSLNSLRNGGLVNPATVLAYNVGSGVRIGQPSVQPTVGAMLPGPPVKQPAAYEPKRPLPRDSVATLANSPPHHTPEIRVTGSGAASIVAPGPSQHPVDETLSDSAIVYDPQGGRYVNKYPMLPVPVPATNQADISTASNPVGKAATEAFSPGAPTSLDRPGAENPNGSSPLLVRGSKPAPSPSISRPHADPGPRGNTGVHTSYASGRGSAPSSTKASAPSGGGSSGSHAASGGGGGGTGGGGGSAGGHSGGGSGGGSHR